CHSVEALLFSVDDARGPLWVSGRCTTVFCEVAVAVPASLENAHTRAHVAADQMSDGVPGPRSRWTGRGAWQRCTPGYSRPAAPLRGGAADSPGRRRTAGLPLASVWPRGAVLPPASGPDTSPGLEPQRAVGTC